MKALFVARVRGRLPAQSSRAPVSRPMLHLHFANRLETLTDELAVHLSAEAHAAPVFAPAQVIVPSAAMRRTLTLALARREGVCANVDFSWLASWLWGQIVRLVPGVSPQS